MLATTLRRLIWRGRRVVISICTDTVSYGSSDKKGLPELCSVLPPASNISALCCSATRTVLSVLSHTLHIRTTFSELPQALSWSATWTVLSVLSHTLYIRTTFSELPQALSWSAIVFSGTRVVFIFCQTYFDSLHYWSWIFCFLG